MTTKEEKITILYELEDPSIPFFHGGLNMMEVPYNLLISNEKEVLVMDLVGFLRNSPIFAQTDLGKSYAFYVYINGGYRYLPALTSILPIRIDNTIQLKLVRAWISPFVPIKQLSSFLEDSRMMFDHLASEEMKHANGRPSWNNGPGKVKSNASSSSQGGGGSGGGGGFAGSARNQPAVNPLLANASSSAVAGSDGAGNGIMSDETSKAISDATEAAKEAARSLFSFAANMGKSVMEAASSLANHPVNLSTQTALSTGSVLTVGQSRLVVRNWLAEGAYGLVYTAVIENSVSPQASSYLGQVVVIKQLLCQAQEQVEEAHHELSLLRKLRGHPGIISLLDYASIAVSSSPVRRQVLLIFPYYSLGSAAQLAENQTVEEVQALFLTYHLAQTLLFLHEQGYTHRDVKPHNLLLTAPTTSEEVQLGLGRPVLVDFGSVAPARQALSSRQDALNCEEDASRKTSLAYRAPELVAIPSPPCTITEAVDVWAVGCTLFAIANGGRSPFESAAEGVQRLGVLNGRYNFPPRLAGPAYSEGFRQLVKRTLRVNPQERCTMEEIVQSCAQILAHA
eukprot:gene2040-2223_t